MLTSSFTITRESLSRTLNCSSHTRHMHSHTHTCNAHMHFRVPPHTMRPIHTQTETYADLWQWSVERYDLFWENFFHFSDLKYSSLYDEVVDTTKNIAEIPEWFRGCRMNYAENLLKHKDGDKVAIITYGECAFVRVCVCVCVNV